MNVAAWIFARGGSKGIPGKNLRHVGGKPLLVHAIEQAQASDLITSVNVSTDSETIAAVARAHCVNVPWLRPAELATDDSPEWLSWQHAIRSYGPNLPDVFVSVPCTSPLRLPEDIDNCIRMLVDNEECNAVITVREPGRNPYFNMVEMGEGGYCRLAITQGRSYYRRQAAPTVYDVTTVAYAVWPRYILEATDLMDGMVKAVVVPVRRALDIDCEDDLGIAEMWWSERETAKGVAW